MGKAFNVSDNIGFDGNSYFCRRCGKAGYQRPTQVRGHLALCEGTLARKGIAPTTAYNHSQPLNAAVNRGLSGSQQLQQPLEVAPVNNPVADNTLAARYEQLDSRMAAMENESRHMLLQLNQPSQDASDWFQRYKPLVVVAAVVLALVFISSQSHSCPSVGGSADKGLTARGFGEKALTKMSDKALSKTVDMIFK